MAARIPFKVTILTLFAALTVGLSAVVLYVDYARNSQSSLHAADKLLEQTAARVLAATNWLIEPLLALTDSGALLPGIETMADPSGRHLLAPLLFASLERYPQMASVYVGNGRGDFYRIASLAAFREGGRAALEAPPEAVFAVQTISSEDGRRVERWRFLDGAKREIGAKARANADFDPRKRAWYFAARGSTHAVVTDYYVFATASSVGMTVARSAGDAQSSVFAIDLTLTSISRYLAVVRGSLPGTDKVEIALFNLDGRILAHSDHAAYERLLDASSPPRIPSVGEIGSGVMARVAAAYRTGAAPQLSVTGADGVHWRAHVTQLAPAYGEGTYLAVAVPVDAILGPLARALRSLDVAPAPPLRSSIAEIHDLARGLATAKVMLGAFAKYVPKNLVRQIVGSGAAPRLGGERRVLTVFFSDVRDFTTLSEAVAPERLLEITSEYLDGLVSILLANRGTVDKFVGDEIMAYWNAPLANPDHAADGCRAMLRCRNWSNARNEAWRREGRPILYTRFALHLGDAIVGNVGSSDRMDYTVVGATINLGSRLEGLNKIYGTQVLITQAVVDKIGNAFVHRPVDRVLAKGAVHPLDVHELLGVHPDRAEGAPDLRVDLRTVARCAAWRTFYELYLRADWSAAAAALADFRARHGEDGLTTIYAERLRRFASEPPPADWDRAARYTEK